MAIKTTAIEPHWNYLLSIETDIDLLSRYVEFDEQNFECFSMEIARVLLAASAEVDVVCKQLCRKLNPGSRAGSINQYRDEIVAAIPGLPGFEVRLARFGLTLHPWEQWRELHGVPHWWTAYNKTKHHRHDHYDLANLKNALNAVAGLFVVVLYLYREKARAGELLPTAQLLRVGDQHFGGKTFHDFEMGINYDV